MLSTQTKSEELKGSGKRFHVHTQQTASVCAGQTTLCSALPWNSAFPVSEARTEQVVGMFWSLSDMRRFANPLLSALALCGFAHVSMNSTLGEAWICFRLVVMGQFPGPLAGS